MNPYIPHTPEDVREMLQVLGMESEEELFADIPESVRLKGNLALPKSKSEAEVKRILTKMAKANITVDELVNFMGAGAYDHLIPAYSQGLVARGEYFTSYTPYQAEVSQGTLQYIFEFQTMLMELTGMDVANASLYDGGTACVEALLMACVVNRKQAVAVSETIHPETKEIIETYLPLQGIEVRWVPEKDGVTSLEGLEGILGDDSAVLLIQSPNFYGLLEDIEKYAEIAHKVKKTSLAVATDPIARDSHGLWWALSWADGGEETFYEKASRPYRWRDGRC